MECYIISNVPRLVGQGVKTPPSHGGIRGSSPLRAVIVISLVNKPLPGVGEWLICYAKNTLITTCNTIY